MASDWIWNALSAVAGLGTLVFTGFLYLVSRRQADISAEQTAVSKRQADIAAKQTTIQQAQHDLLVQQDTARKPALEILNVTVPRWEGGALWFNAEIANAGGSQVAPNAVLLKWKTPEGRQDGKFGRVLYRVPREAGNLILPGDVATFTCQIMLASKPATSEETMWLNVLAVDGSQSMEIPVRLP